MTLLARRNLFRERTRFALTLLGVAASVGLILLLAGYRAGVYAQASAYLANTPGSLVVAERGIQNFLGTSSVLPGDAVEAARRTAGVERVIPVISQFVIFERHGRKDGFFLIGYEPDSGGGPWRLAEGREPISDDELVIDRTTAVQHQIAIGDRLALLDREAVIVGLSDETTFWAGSIAFTRITTLEALLRAPGLRSFLIVTPRAGADVATVRAALARIGTEAIAKDDVIANDRRLMARVYDAPIGLMLAIAFVVGVLVVGLVVYTATVERRREFGALKAIGASNRFLYAVVTVQALFASAVGAAVGVAFASLARAVLTAWRPQFRVDLEPGVIVVALAGSLVMAVLGALLPARSIGRMPPAEVFRG